MAFRSLFTRIPVRILLSTSLRSLTCQSIRKRECLLIKNQLATQFTIRTMSSEKARSVKIEDLLSTAKNIEKGEEKTIIIDVREVHEIQETGIIPGGVNIPLGTVEAAMGMDPDAFKNKYGKDKPDSNTKIILSCRSGKRSLDAYYRLEKLGFKNLYNYDGGWLGYEEYIKKTQKS